MYTFQCALRRLQMEPQVSVQLYTSIHSFLYAQVQDFLIHFWQGMPTHMLPVLGCQAAVDLIVVCDFILYRVSQKCKRSANNFGGRLSPPPPPPHTHTHTLDETLVYGCKRQGCGSKYRLEYMEVRPAIFTFIPDSLPHSMFMYIIYSK